MKIYLFIIIAITSLLLFNNFLLNYQNKNKKTTKKIRKVIKQMNHP